MHTGVKEHRTGPPGAAGGFRRGGGDSGHFGGRGGDRSGHFKDDKAAKNKDAIWSTGEIHKYADLQTQGYGFIKPDKGGANVFFHVNGKGNTSVKDIWGQAAIKVRYTEGVNEKGVCAEYVSLIQGEGTTTKGHRGDAKGICRDYDSATGICPRGTACPYKHSQVVCTRKDDNDKSGDVEVEETGRDSLWEPPLLFQRHNLEGTDGKSRTLFFPLELTNKDYLRRIFEIVARGISGPVVRITQEKRLEVYYNKGGHDSSQDLYYLLKQILAPDKSGGDQLAHRTAYLATSSSHITALTEAAEHLLDKRNAVFHLVKDSSRLVDLALSFTSAEILLETFGAAAVVSSRELNNLKHQFDRHCRFKERRMAAFSWQWEDEGMDVKEDAAAGGEGEDVGERIEDEHAAIWDSLTKALSPQEKAHTALVQFLLDTAARVLQDKEAARKAQNYDEGSRLLQLHKDIQATTTAAGGWKRLDDLGGLIEEAKGLLQRWRTKEAMCAQQDEYPEAAAAKDKGNTLHSLIVQARALIASGGNSQLFPRDIPPSTHLFSIKLAPDVTDVARSNNEERADGTTRNVIELLGSARVDFSGINLQDVDLSGLHLLGLTFRNTDFRGTTLQSANLSQSDLSGAKLSGADLKNCNLINAKINGTDLSGTDLSNADLSGANLQGTNLMNANLQGANLLQSDLSGAKLSGADLKNSNLIHAKINGLDLSGTDLSNADLSGANLQGTNLMNAKMQGANLLQSDLSGAKLSGADLKNCNLINAKINGSDLSGTDLSSADLSGANLQGTNLMNAKLQGARLPLWNSGLLERVKLAGANGWMPADKDLSNAKLKGADLSGSDLSGTDLNRANLQGTNLMNAKLHGTRLPLWNSGLLERVKLAGAKGWMPADKDLSNAKLKGADLSGTDLSGADLSGADLSHAELSAADLSKSNLTGTVLQDATVCGAIFHEVSGSKHTQIRFNGNQLCYLRVDSPMVFEFKQYCNNVCLNLRTIKVQGGSAMFASFDEHYCPKNMEVKTGPSAQGPWTSVVKLTLNIVEDEQLCCVAEPNVPVLTGFVQLLVYDTYGSGWSDCHVNSLCLAGEGFG